MKQMLGYLTLLSIVCLLSLAFTWQSPADLKASMARGKSLYGVYCQSCHGDQGQGIESVFPPLAKSDYLMADKKRSIQQILYGASGEVKVNNVTYIGDMPAFDI